MINPKTAQLTAINEALRSLDYAPPVAVAGDALVFEAIQLLNAARAGLTDKPWPEAPHPSADSRRYVVWHLEKREAQQKDGLQ